MKMHNILSPIINSIVSFCGWNRIFNKVFSQKSDWSALNEMNIGHFTSRFLCICQSNIVKNRFSNELLPFGCSSCSLTSVQRPRTHLKCNKNEKRKNENKILISFCYEHPPEIYIEIEFHFTWRWKWITEKGTHSNQLRWKSIRQTISIKGKICASFLWN